MKYNTKHIEEHHEKLMVAHAKSILTKDNTMLDSLKSDSRHEEWVDNPKYTYMCRQMTKWINFLTNYDFKGLSVIEVVYYEKEGRSQGKKEDMIIVLSNGVKLKWSLKTLKSGSRIQTYSSTFYSFILGLLFDRKSMRKFFHGKQEFTSRGIKKIKTILVSEGYSENFINLIEELFNLSKELRIMANNNVKYFDMSFNGSQNYIDEGGKIVHGAWAKICEHYRNKYKSLIISLIKEIQFKDGINMIRRALLTQGIIGDHNTIVVTLENVYDLSHVNINIVDTVLDVDLCSEGLRFTYNCGNMNIVSTIPLTLNRNGAWNLDMNRDNNYFKTDKTKVAFGDLRPIKSKQIATSTNTYIKIGDLT